MPALCKRASNHWLTVPGAVALAEREGTVDGHCRQCVRRAERQANHEAGER
ncbi:MAG: hypothetical protein U5K30_15150 [Acidimicrobiales bacterium]|nr:hypothetical protein [Acidimicrobiales bacterium]